MTPDTPVRIAGAGLAGLALATALGRRGHPVRVLEQAPAISEVGAGLQISPNGAAVLAALGLGDALARNATRSEGVVLKDGRDGAAVIRLDMSKGFGGRAFWLCHRADLIEMLATAARAAGAVIETGCGLNEVAATGDLAVLGTGRGQIETPLLVGADGIRSRVRLALLGAASPEFTGQVAWRALIPWEGNAEATAQVHMGPGRHIVCYPLRHGRLMNVVAVEERPDWAEEGWDHEDDPANLHRAFAGFAPEVRDLLAQVETVHLWGLFKHPVAQPWGRGPMGLIGDAAHPTLPFMAQGANLALEDAWILAECIAAADASAEVWPRMGALRTARVTRALAAADGNARNYHLSGPARLAAHTSLRLFDRVAPGAMLRRFDWLYGYDPTGAP
ncbi:MAG: FAD-dependent monooxygenase [Pseudomonadota bacterium]